MGYQEPTAVKTAQSMRSMSSTDFLAQIKEHTAEALEPFDTYKQQSCKPDKHFCDFCKEWYAKYNAEEERKFQPTIKKPKYEHVFPKCSGSLETPEIPLAEWKSMGGSDEEYKLVEVNSDPVKWAAAELGFLTDGFEFTNKGRQVSADRWYQKAMLDCSAELKVYRAGRRVGKSESMAIEVLFYLNRYEDFNVILIAPFETQLMKFEEKLIHWLDQSVSMKDSKFLKYNKTKHTITFSNGSKYEGYCTGGDKQSKTADRVRGAGANLLVLDEADYISEDALQAVLAVKSDDPECRILLSSTPSGKRGFFYEWCTDKTFGFKEFHILSHASPSYTYDADKLYRGTLSVDKYKKEYLGDFGTLLEALLSPEHINKCTDVYDMARLRNAGPRDGCRYVVGVDWNGRKIGTNILVVEYDAKYMKYRMVDKVVVRDTEHNFENSCWAVIKTFQHWKADYCYVDAGFGDMQTEMIKKTAKQLGDTKLQRGYVPVRMNGFQEIRDPVTGQIVKKENKEFAINLMVNAFERGMISVPYSENYKDDEEDWGIIPQLYDLAIEKYGTTGRPKWASTVDHTVTCLYLAILGFHMKMSDLGSDNFTKDVFITAHGDHKELAGGIVIDGYEARSKQKGFPKDKQITPDTFISRDLSGRSATAGPSWGGIPTTQAKYVKEDSHGNLIIKYDNSVGGIRSHNLGVLRRSKSF